MTDQPEGADYVPPQDRSKTIKALLRQAENPDLPFDSRSTAVHSLRVEFPAIPEIEAVDEAYQEAIRSKDTDSYRGYVSNLSPKTKAGQMQLQRLKKAVLSALRPERPVKEAGPKAPRAKKEPSNPCVCGCGAVVHNLFAPGHDAKVHGLLLKVSRGLVPLTDVHQFAQPHLRDLAARWKIPTDNNGDILVVPLPPKAKDATPPAG